MSQALSAIRIVNIGLTALGAAVFAAFFLYVTLAPEDFDQRTREFAISKVKATVTDRFAVVAQSKAAKKASELAGVISERLEGEIQALRESLDAGLADFIADVLAAACKLDCERRELAAHAVTAFFEAYMARLGVALDRTKTLIESDTMRLWINCAAT